MRRPPETEAVTGRTRTDPSLWQRLSLDEFMQHIQHRNLPQRGTLDLMAQDIGVARCEWELPQGRRMLCFHSDQLRLPPRFVTDHSSSTLTSALEACEPALAIGQLGPLLQTVHVLIIGCILNSPYRVSSLPAHPRPVTVWGTPLPLPPPSFSLLHCHRRYVILFNRFAHSAGPQ